MTYSGVDHEFKQVIDQSVDDSNSFSPSIKPVMLLRVSSHSELYIPIEASLGSLLMASAVISQGTIYPSRLSCMHGGIYTGSYMHYHNN